MSHTYIPDPSVPPPPQNHPPSPNQIMVQGESEEDDVEDDSTASLVGVMKSPLREMSRRIPW